MASYSRLPGGNVSPSRFVKLQSDNTVVHCGAGEAPWGISQESTRNKALTGWDDGYAGISGDPAINVYGPVDDACPLELGGTVTAGQPIKASTNGVGVAATTDADKVGAICLQGGVSGDIVSVRPVRYDIAS